jgi:internalin A
MNIDRSMMPHPSLLYGKYDITNIKNLITLKHLDLDNCGIISLNGIENLLLIELDLYSNKIKNIEPLRKMKSLECLELSHNKITNFTPLNNLANLKTLFLNGIHIIDLKPLSQLSNLKELHMTLNSKIKDLSPLMKLKNLQKLNFSNDGKKLYLHKNPLKEQLINLFRSLPNVESNLKDCLDYL